MGGSQLELEQPHSDCVSDTLTRHFDSSILTVASLKPNLTFGLRFSKTRITASISLTAWLLSSSSSPGPLISAQSGDTATVCLLALFCPPCCVAGATFEAPLLPKRMGIFTGWIVGNGSTTSNVFCIRSDRFYRPYSKRCEKKRAENIQCHFFTLPPVPGEIQARWYKRFCPLR